MGLGKFGDGIDWDETWHQQHAGPHRDPELLTKLASHRPTCASPKVIDLGCSIGRFCPMFVEAGYAYLGVDQADVALGIARERNPGQKFEHSWLGTIPYEGEFDVAILNAVLQHNVNAAQSRIVAAAYRALKPGGLLFAAESTVRTATRTQRTSLGWIHLFESVGFAVVETWHPNPEYRLNDHYLLRKPGPSLPAEAPGSPETSAEPVEVRIKSFNQIVSGDTLHGRSAIKSMAGRQCRVDQVQTGSVQVTHLGSGKPGSLALSTLKKSWCKHV